MLSNTILAQWQHPVASSEALNLLHWAMHAVKYQCIAMAIKMASKEGVFFSSLLGCLSPWWLLRQCRASSQPMAVSRGIQCGRFIGQCHVYHFNASTWQSKWPAMRVHLFVTLPFLFAVNVDERPCYSQFKLMHQHTINLNYTASILVYYGLPPPTMDAIFSTIVASGRAQI